MKGLLQKVGYGLYVMVICVTLMEVCYRYQVVDFYVAELKALNPGLSEMDGNSKINLLASGDSFLAHQNNFATQMRPAMPDFNMINTAVSGTSIVEAALIVPDRIQTFNPDIFIYQIYVGNDLTGVRHNLSWSETSFVRNIYWAVSDKLLSLRFLNYRSGQIKGWFSERDAPRDYEKPFSYENYSRREKLYAKGDPTMINDAVLLRGGRKDDLQDLLDRFDGMISDLKPEAEVFVVVIPHKAQVSAAELTRMSQVGFSFDPDFPTNGNDYPFMAMVRKHFMNRTNIHLVDVLPVLSGKSGEQYYYNNDEHLNESGHRVIADHLLSMVGHRHSIEVTKREP